MKKIFFVLFLGVLMTNASFSQMSFSGNSIKKSAFDLTEKKTNLFEDNAITSKIVITDEDNDMTKKRRRRGGRRSGGGDFNLLWYTREGLTIPIGGLADYASLGFFGQLNIEGVFQNKFAIGISFGYYVYPGNTITMDDGYGGTMSISADPSYVLPVVGTFKYFLMEDEFKPYVGADLGLMFHGSAGNGSITKFGGTPRVGFLYYFAERYLVGLDASCNLLTDGVALNIGLQLGYVFGN